MKKWLLLLLAVFVSKLFVQAQKDTIAFYQKKDLMIPMRDGIRLHTIVYEPVGIKEKVPILLQRTPYGANAWGLAPDSIFSVNLVGRNYSVMLREGYYLVVQDVRGKFGSEGAMEIHQPMVHLTNKNAVDESTDTWDTIDWLIKNLSGNNGRAGIVGISYGGWETLVGTVDPHPALKAASEQACMADLFLGDDFHHNGAFRLSYGMEYTYSVERDKFDNDFPFPQFDLYDWYLKLGSLRNVNEKYFHGRIPTWNHFIEHPNYDSFWQRNSTLDYAKKTSVPQLHVGGYFDQEDINGPQLMYHQQEKEDRAGINHLVLGPWYHGQWARGRGDSLGKIAFNSNTSYWFQSLQKKWFDYWLKGIGTGRFEEAYCFQTGTNEWRSYPSWPPSGVIPQRLYLQADKRCGFQKPTTSKGSISFISDPVAPVPYRALPIEATYGTGSRWRTWQVEDQRFVYTRPDVISFIMDSLQEDLIVTGKIIAHLFASTSGSDADWVVKLIDVYPDQDPSNLLMSGYQLPVAMEVFRGRYRKSFSNPTPLVPNKPEEFVIDLHDINHRFKKGHKVMVQVQSSWFPLIDRNPQRYVPSIFDAKESDFIKATHTIHCSASFPSYIELPVMME